MRMRLSKKDARPGYPSRATPGDAVSHRRLSAGNRLTASERVRHLRGDHGDVRIVAALDEAVGGRRAGVLRNIRALDGDVGEASVEREIAAELVLRADGDPEPIFVRQARRAIRRVGRSLDRKSVV